MYRKIWLSTLLILLLFASLVQASANVVNGINELISPMLDKGQMGIYIKSLTEDTILYDLNSQRPLIPASNQKLVTSIGAYYLLGTDYTYKTELYMDERMVIVGDRYFGDLVLKGYGDPLLTYPVLIEMLKETPLVEAVNFHGQLYIDDTHFDFERFVPDWNYSGAKEVGAIIFRDTNLAKSTDSPEVVSQNVGRTVQMVFRPLKIKHHGNIRASWSMPNRMKLVTYRESQPMSEILSIGNKASDNSIMEQVFKSISAERLGLGTVRGTEDVLKEFFLNTLELDPTQYRLADGSGLSRYNRISTLYLSKMMEYVFWNPYPEKNVSSEEIMELVLSGSHPYLETLAIAGVDGTLANRMAGTRVYGKTGTLTGVDALSGYIVTPSNQVVIFSFLVNDFTVNRTDLRAWQDQVVRYIYENY